MRLRCILILDQNTMKIMLIYAPSWLGMVMLAILNGVIREHVYEQYMRELSAHQLSLNSFLVAMSWGIPEGDFFMTTIY